MFMVEHYCTPQGEDLFGAWFAGLADRQARARIAARLERLEAGNFGDCKALRDGVWELRVDWGPGYRVYYAREGRAVIVLLVAGDKRRQSADVKRAVACWQELQRRRS